MAKFREIPRYTRDGHYRVDIPLDYLPRQIERYETQYGLDMCPDFQRGRVWDRARQVAYVEHFLKGGQGSSEIRFNCPGWMGNREETSMVLVDGLQRLTALLGFLKNYISAFGFYRSEFEDRIPNDLSLSFRVNDLRTRADVLRWYIEINAGGVAHTDEEINRVRDLLAKEEG